MNRDNYISSSEDEFDLELLNEETTATHKELDETEKVSSNEENEEGRGVRRRNTQEFARVLETE